MCDAFGDAKLVKIRITKLESPNQIRMTEFRTKEKCQGLVRGFYSGHFVIRHWDLIRGFGFRKSSFRPFRGCPNCDPHTAAIATRPKSNYDSSAMTQQAHVLPNLPKVGPVSLRQTLPFEPVCAIFRRYLHDQKLKFTPERAMMLDTVLRKTQLFEPEQLIEDLKALGHRVSRATVYRTFKSSSGRRHSLNRFSSTTGNRITRLSWVARRMTI